MWWQCAVLLQGRHLASTPMDTNKSACVMGVTLLRVFAPLQGGGFLPAHHGLFFVYFLQLLFSLLNSPLFAPPHYSGAQELCQPIDALPPQLLQEPRQPIDNSTPAPIALFVKVSPGRACNDYNLNFLC